MQQGDGGPLIVRNAERHRRVPRPRSFGDQVAELSQTLAGDYLLVVPEAFLPAIQPLVDLRTSQGLRVVVSPLEAINDEFNGGRKSSYAIKRYLRC